MLKTVEGVYENGQVKLLEPLPGIDRARVVVTVLPDHLSKSNPPVSTLEPFAKLSPEARAQCVAEIQRRWRHRLSSSDEFSRAKADEIALEDRHLGPHD
ncbi:MAG: hypothetical protein V2J55_19995 [Candidatus Competibacteraceae bacterium]|nr:hypothetical protein [Candidatus Competibacteraceae bacterium]